MGIAERGWVRCCDKCKLEFSAPSGIEKVGSLNVSLLDSVYCRECQRLSGWLKKGKKSGRKKAAGCLHQGFDVPVS